VLIGRAEQVHQDLAPRVFLFRIEQGEEKTMAAICRKKKQMLAILAAVAVGMIMLAGAMVWILSLEGIVLSLWASIMSVIFTFLGVFSGLLQWLAQLQEQKAINRRGDLLDSSDTPGQKYSQAECLTSRVACLPPVEIPSSLKPLSSSGGDNSLTVALREIAVMNEVEQNGSHLQRGVRIHIHIYQDKEM
jgi:hypothetical protein